MMMECPFPGLIPYDSSTRHYFFSRERLESVVISNAYAAPLTILYGRAGVGKSSLLLAGVVPKLQGDPGVRTILVRDWQRKAFLEPILEQFGGTPNPKLSFDERIQQARSSDGKRILVILDQFEEYLLYHPPDPSRDGFEAGLARAINRWDNGISFIISMREEHLCELDRFKGRIINLLGNRLRVESLTVGEARRAIARSRRRFRDLSKTRVKVEPRWLKELLTSVTLPGSTPPRVNLPVLQVMLQKAWSSTDSGILQIATLRALGPPSRILDSYVEERVGRLRAGDRKVAATLLDGLITPTLTKRAFSASELTVKGLSTEKAEHVLGLMAGSGLLVKGAAEPGSRYQIVHDALVPAVWDWRRRFEAVTAARERSRTRLWIGSLCVIAALLVAVNIVIGARSEALISAANAAQARSEARFADYIAEQAQLIAGYEQARAEQAKKELEDAEKILQKWNQAMADLYLVDDKTLNPKTAPPIIYVHYSGEELKAAAESLRLAALRHRYASPSHLYPVQVGPEQSELRYFRRQDDKLAAEIARVLEEEGAPPLRTRLMEHLVSKIKRTDSAQFELWLVRDAVSPASSPVREAEQGVANLRKVLSDPNRSEDPPTLIKLSRRLRECIQLNGCSGTVERDGFRASAAYALKAYKFEDRRTLESEQHPVREQVRRDALEALVLALAAGGYLDLARAVSTARLGLPNVGPTAGLSATISDGVLGRNGPHRVTSLMCSDWMGDCVFLIGPEGTPCNEGGAMHSVPLMLAAGEIKAGLGIVINPGQQLCTLGRVLFVAASVRN